MNEELRRLNTVQSAIEAVVAAGQESFRPGDVASHQRQAEDPIPVWQLRQTFQVLQAQGFITLDEATGNWHKTNRNAAAAG